MIRETPGRKKREGRLDHKPFPRGRTTAGKDGCHRSEGETAANRRAGAIGAETLPVRPVAETRYLTLAERTAADIARRLNRTMTPATRRKWERRAAPQQALVDALRPVIAELDRTHCYAEAERLAVLRVVDGAEA